MKSFCVRWQARFGFIKNDLEEVLLRQIAMHQTERRALVLRLNRSPTRPLPRARLRR